MQGGAQADRIGRAAGRESKGGSRVRCSTAIRWVGGWSIARPEAELLKKTRGHYPAPLAALEAVQTGLEQGMEAGLRVERERFGELAVSEVCRNLVAIFFATTALKKDDGVPQGHARTREGGATWRGRAPGSWARGSQGPRWRKAGSRGAAQGRGPAAGRQGNQGRARRARLAAQAAADQQVTNTKGRARSLSGTGDWQRLLARGPGHRGGVRGPRREAAGDERHRGDRGAGSGHRDQHLDHPDFRDRRAHARIPTASSACTTSRRWTGCRCSR